MTDKLIAHHEARQQLQFLNRTVLITEETILNNENLSKYITDMEAMEKHFIESEKKMRDNYFELLKKHNELTRDVRLYFENILIIDEYKKQNPNLTNTEIENNIATEIVLYRQLFSKLSKVGDEK